MHGGGGGKGPGGGVSVTHAGPRQSQSNPLSVGVTQSLVMILVHARFHTFLPRWRCPSKRPTALESSHTTHTTQARDPRFMRPLPSSLLSLVVLVVATTMMRASNAFLRSPSTSPVAAAAPRNVCALRRYSSASKARDFTLEIPDHTLPDESLRKVHVLDTGSPPATTTQGTHPPPPLVLIGGTAQSINSWVGHMHALSKDRRLIIYEARGQGKTTGLDLEKASIQTHIEDFRRVHSALALPGAVDLCGFSFGGRVSLGVAAEAPELVRRLVLTGVPAERDAVGRLIIKSWKASLEQGRLKDFAWNSMLQCHSPAFLAKFEEKIPEWVDFVVKGNTAEGILSIVSKSHTSDVADPYHTVQLAQRVQAPTLLLGGAQDKVATAGEIQRLAEMAGQEWPVVIFEDCAHNCVFERPLAWREEVLRFLS